MFLKPCCKKKKKKETLLPPSLILLLLDISSQFLVVTPSLRIFVFFFLEPCQVEVRLLLAYNSSSRIPKSPWIEGGEMSPQVETSIEGTIPFSKSVKVYIMPKPARR